MHRILVGVTCAVLLAVHGSHAVQDDVRQRVNAERRMSFHNRLLLNRAVLAGLRFMEVLLLATETGGRMPQTDVAAAVARLGGRVLRTDSAIGYLRIEVAPERLLELIASPAIEAYQISSFSRGAWYRDGPPLANAQMFRGYEVTPIAATEPSADNPHLPALTPAEARSPGFTADDDVGVGEWMANRPTFDGRGVTIALVESALPSFADPVFRTAKTLDGRNVPKIAGILNAIDPANDDETRVRLITIVDAPKSWARIGNRTYILPGSGRYRVGMLEVPAGANLIHQFAVIEKDETREVWIDANGNASFQDETPLADVNERFEPRFLTLRHPRKAEVSFVMGRGRQPHVVHIYIGKGSHQTMTASVAAGQRSADSLASGVAPNARVLLVRMSSSGDGLGKTLEGFIEAAARPDVDVITASTGLSIVPDTAADFVGLLFRRLNAVHHKPIVNAAGNFGLMLAHVHAHGDTLSAGGTLGPGTYAALYGGRRLDRIIVHPMSAVGPALDGSIKPDFLVPMERIAASLPWNADIKATPRNAPTRRVPPGYEISCCTSASSPYAAGVAALLISAARQSNVPYSLERLSRAMTVSARLVPGFQPHQQGNGALDISAAWRELVTSFDPPRFVASAGIVHPLAQYAARGPEGHGILEYEGWTAGTKGIREISLRRESGPAHPVTYRLTWSGGDGTFNSAPSVTLPLRETVPVRVNVNVESSGAHSGLLNLHDPDTNAVVFRTQATVVATERIDPATGSLQVKSTVGLMQQNAHYLHVPPDAGAIAFELEVTRGVVQPTILQSHGLVSSYYGHVHPMDVFFVGAGKYHVLMPNPEPGTWTFRVKQGSTWMPEDLNLGPRDDGDADYILRMRVLASSIRPSAKANGGVTVALTNSGAPIAEPVLQGWPGSLKSHRATFARNGLPNVIDIDVPREATSLSLQLRSAQSGTKVELYLYDCTTGECFSYDVAFPAARSQTLVVRKPAAGRWVAAVNAAPFPAPEGSFVLDEVITTGTPVRRTSSTSRASGTQWRETIADLPQPPAVEGRTPVILFELLDAAADRGEIEHPWSTARHFVRLRDRPVVVGTAIYRR